MAVRKVLILTAGFGEGHNAAARNLRDALLAEDPAATIEMRDIFREAYGWMNELSVRGYLALINHLPGVWNLVFQWLDRSSAVPEKIGVFRRAAKLLSTALTELAPDVVVSTYPGYNHLLDHLHRGSGRRAFVQVTIVTDSLTVNRVWHTGHSDWYVVANEATAEVMRAQGVEPGKLRVLGFPVPAFFAERWEKNPAANGEPWRVLFMVNSGKRIAVETVRELLALDGIDLSVTVGRDEALEDRIRALGEGSRVYGWTKELPRLMADAHIVVSKAGGATVQECLAACTPMIVSQVVPGQEEGNARLIAESGAGVIAETPEAITAAVRSAFAGGGAVWTRWHAASRRLSRPHAARDMARWIFEMPV